MGLTGISMTDQDIYLPLGSTEGTQWNIHVQLNYIRKERYLSVHVIFILSWDSGSGQRPCWSTLFLLPLYVCLFLFFRVLILRLRLLRPTHRVSATQQNERERERERVRKKEREREREREREGGGHACMHTRTQTFTCMHSHTPTRTHKKTPTFSCKQRTRTSRFLF